MTQWVEDSTYLSDLKIPTMAKNALFHDGITTVGEFRAKTDDYLLRIPSFGKTSRRLILGVIGGRTPPSSRLPSLTPEAQAVLDAVGVWCEKTALQYRDDPHLPEYAALIEANDVYRATLAPPDPIDELIAAAKDAANFAGEIGARALRTAIEAVERSRAKTR